MSRNSISEDKLGAVSGGKIEAVKDVIEGAADDTAKNKHLILKNAKGEVCGRFPNTEAGIVAMQKQAARLGISTVTDLAPTADGTYDLGKKVHAT